nr:trypsin-like peptidase domain-containing protein [Anaerolineae bacterium]
MNKNIIFRYAGIVLLLIGLMGCSAVALPAKSALIGSKVAAAIASPAETRGPAQAPAPVTKNDTVAALEGELEQIYTKVNSSVVSIQVTQTQALPNVSQLPGLPFFFGEPFGFRQNPQQPDGSQQFYQHGAGSGFVWDKAGHIITNNHVVDGADKITVTFTDHTIVPAEVVGADPDSDLAVLKVDLPADQLQPIALGDSSQLKVGQLAVAIGNPFSLENTMTVGFVSALGRVLPVGGDPDQNSGLPTPSYTIPDIIQTDAPINPGNSGGVLVNDQGQVIGVTAAIESPVRASVGVGFAIPAAVVDQVVPALIETGHYEHPWLGLSGISLFPELAQAMDLKDHQHGALVIDVTPGSPAAQAGLHGSDRQVKIEDRDVRGGGDVITAFNGQPVTGFDDLVSELAGATKVGQTVKLTILRDGKEQTLDVTLAARPQTTDQTPQSRTVTGHGPYLGLQGLDLTPEIAKAMGLPVSQKGVLIEQVEIGSPADVADLNGSYMAADIEGR